MAVISFSVKLSQQERLEALAKEGESLNLVAKRLLLQSLDNGLDDRLPEPESDRLSELEVKLSELDSVLNGLADYRDRISVLEAKLENLTLAVEEKQQSASVRIGHLESQINALIEKKLMNSDLTEPSPPISDRIGIDTSALAALLNVNRSTVSRWKAKNDPRLSDWQQNNDGKWIKT
jgi:hypothetical protein